MARSRLRLLVVAGVVLIAVVAGACAPDSRDKPNVRNVPAAFIDIEGTTGGGGLMGIDITLGDNYNPCHLQTSPMDPNFKYNDVAYGACQESHVGRHSYYKVVAYPAGAPNTLRTWVGNMDRNYCQSQWWCPNLDEYLIHDWANKARTWAAEFYPSDPNEGAVRVEGNFDRTHPDGTAWSGTVGKVQPPRKGQSGMGNLWGWFGGGPWSDEHFEVQAFQMPPWTTYTTGGFPQWGFGVARTGFGGLYATHPLPNGHYKLYVWDNTTGVHYIAYRDVRGETRLDLNPHAPCFGLGPGTLDAAERPAC